MAKRYHLSCLTAVAAVFLSTLASAQSKAAEIKTEQEKLLYFMGIQMGEGLLPMALSPTEVELVLRGTRDAIRGEATDLDPRVYGPQLARLAEDRQRTRLLDEEPKAAGYLTRMAAEKGAIVTDTGLIFLSLKTGTGAIPEPDALIELQFKGTLRDGTVFDSSLERGQPIQIPLNRVLPCWQEGFSLIKEGGKAKLTCPAELAYADRGVGRIPPGAAITFEVELVRIVE